MTQFWKEERWGYNIYQNKRNWKILAWTPLYPAVGFRDNYFRILLSASPMLSVHQLAFENIDEFKAFLAFLRYKIENFLQPWWSHPQIRMSLTFLHLIPLSFLFKRSFVDAKCSRIKIRRAHLYHRSSTGSLKYL